MVFSRLFQRVSRCVPWMFQFPGFPWSFRGSQFKGFSGAFQETSRLFRGFESSMCVQMYFGAFQSVSEGCLEAFQEVSWGFGAFLEHISGSQGCLRGF